MMIGKGAFIGKALGVLIYLWLLFSFFWCLEDSWLTGITTDGWMTLNHGYTWSGNLDFIVGETVYFPSVGIFILQTFRFIQYYIGVHTFLFLSAVLYFVGFANSIRNHGSVSLNLVTFPPPQRLAFMLLFLSVCLISYNLLGWAAERDGRMPTYRRMES
jgi:hypothetical protein